MRNLSIVARGIMLDHPDCGRFVEAKVLRIRPSWWALLSGRVDLHTITIEEARLMRQVAREKNLCTQMGNQFTSHDGFREGVEIIKSGVLGKIEELHVWTNRPIWPQGVSRPKGTPGVPNTVHWYEWLGSAPDRPYVPKAYHDFNWRGWIDFGTGAIGDMACHTANLAYRALKLDLPVSVTADAGDVNPETYPSWAQIAFQFPERSGGERSSESRPPPVPGAVSGTVLR